MCGVAAWVGVPSVPPERGVESVLRMVGAMQHRGPDDAGLWVDPGAGVSLGHRRLAIVDLSAAGHQPMTSSGGRYVLAFNGEIYNHLDIRRQLGREARPWRGHSDTETLLAAIEAWGVAETLSSTEGMFAFVLWDRERAELTIARDRLGEKPMYLGRSKNGWLIASELRALRAAWEGSPELDHRAIADLLTYDFTPSPHTVLADVWKVPAGCVVVLDASTKTPSIRQWWSLATTAASARLAEPSAEVEVVDHLEDRLTASVDRQLRHTDVPIGVFLSGGIDSSLIAALATKVAPKVRSFSIGFTEPEFDESSAAEAVAHFLGTAHTTAMLSGGEAADALMDMLSSMDEPMADPSVLPTFLVSHVARKDVTVALSGDGADELFGGYNRYQWLPGALRAARRVPAALRRPLGRLAWRSPRALDALSRFPGVSGRLRTPAEKAVKLGALLAATDLPELGTWPARGLPPASLNWKGRPYLDGLVQRETEELRAVLPGLTERGLMMQLDARHYLPDDVLTKVDRSSMSASLETRAPFLGVGVVEAAMTVPDGLRFRGGSGKYVLRQLLARHVPKDLWDRPKMGFAIPLGSWLRGPLLEWAHESLSASTVVDNGWLSEQLVSRLWAEHRAGRFDHQRALWPLLILDTWLRAKPAIGAGDDVRIETADPYRPRARL